MIKKGDTRDYTSLITSDYTWQFRLKYYEVISSPTPTNYKKLLSTYNKIIKSTNNRTTKLKFYAYLKKAHFTCKRAQKKKLKQVGKIKTKRKRKNYFIKTKKKKLFSNKKFTLNAPQIQKTTAIISIALFLLLSFLLISNPQITGLLGLEQISSEELSLRLSDSKSIALALTGVPNYISIDGNIVGNGYVRVYYKNKKIMDLVNSSGRNFTNYCEECFVSANSSQTELRIEIDSAILYLDRVNYKTERKTVVNKSIEKKISDSNLVEQNLTNKEKTGNNSSKNQTNKKGLLYRLSQTSNTVQNLIFGISAAPVINSIKLNSTSLTNLTSGNLSVQISPPSNSTLKHIIDWRINQSSIAVLNMPFEANGKTNATDYSIFENNGTVFGATWNKTGGHDGFGAYEFDGLGNYIDLGNDTSLNLTNAITISAWVKTNTEGYVIVKDPVSVGTTYDFTYTGDFQSWIVPETGVYKIEVWGAGGGKGYNVGALANAGFGGYASGEINLTAGQVLNISVGGKGTDGDGIASYKPGGWNGGGRGGYYSTSYQGGGGGGASDVRVNGSALEDRVIVGGAGGGGSYYINSAGGIGGYAAGRNGTQSGGPSANIGHGGTQVAGGAGGDPASATGGYAGSLGTGGDSESILSCAGGGGAGYYGGGGGSGCNGGGGGGGSSYVGGVTNTSHTNGIRAGNGLINITFVSSTVKNVPYALSTNNGGEFLIRNSSINYAVNGTNTITDGNWHQLVATYNGSIMKLYIDGILTNSNNNYSGNLPTNTDPVWIGRHYDPNNSSGYFNGTIDEVMIFNRSLSAEQILALYNNRTDLIVSQETKIGDIWNACVSPNDGNQDGTIVCSNNLTIASSGNYLAPTSGFSSTLNINGSLEGALNEIQTYTLDQYIDFLDPNTGVKYLTLKGLFSIYDVDLSGAIIYSSIHKTVTDLSAVSGISPTHTLWVGNYNNGTGVYVCPNAKKLQDIYYDCANKISFDSIELGTWKNGVNASIVGNQYKIMNISGSGVGSTDNSNLAVIINSSCPTNYTDVLHMVNLTNAHAELANESAYTNKICVKDTTGTNIISNSSGTVFLKLNAASNAHVELGNESNYNFNASMGVNTGTLNCNYPKTFNGTCTTNTQTCLATVSTNFSGGNSNLHIADCISAPYETAVCCGLAISSGNAIIGNETNVTQGGTTSLNITIDGSDNLTGTITGEHTITFYDKGTAIINFSQNFDSSGLDLTLVTINQTDSGIAVNLSGQLTSTKTLYLDDIGYTHICADDTEILTVSDISTNCNEVGEKLFTRGECISGSTKGGISCEYVNSQFKVSNLNHSGLAGSVRCGDVNSSITLISDVSANGTCFSFGTNNAILDCAGYTVIYDTDGNSSTGNPATGIYANKKTNLTIKNCNIQSHNASGTNGYGIYLSNTNNSLIFNNTIQTNGTNNNYGMYIASSLNNTVMSNTILTIGTNSYGIVITKSNNSLFNQTLFSNVAQWLNNTDTSNNTFENTTFIENNGSLKLDAFFVDKTTTVTQTNLNISFNYAFLNSTEIPNLNTSGIITLYNLNLSKYIIKKSTNNEVGFKTCVAPECNNLSLSGTTFVFNVSHFTSYFISNNTAPQIAKLIYPINNLTITNRTTPFLWNNSADLENDTLSYEILVDTNNTFISPNLNSTNISKSNTVNTSFGSPTILPVDTLLFWKVRAFDGREYSPWTNYTNFTIESVIWITLTQNRVDFGGIKNTQERNTSSSLTNGPFILENRGNIHINVSFTGEPVFSSVGFPSNNYQFKIENNESGTLDLSQSTTIWTNVTNSSLRSDMALMDWNLSKNSAETHIKIVVPANENPNAGNYSVYFTGRAGSYN